MKRVALGPWWGRGEEWWRGRSARERRLLSVLAIVAAAAILLVFVVRPLETARARAAADIRTYEMLAMRVRAAGTLAAATAHPGPPAAMVSASAARAEVGVQRVEPDGGRLTVVLNDAAFDKVLRFVADLEKTSGLRVAEAKIERSTTSEGLVSAQFVLTGAG